MYISLPSRALDRFESRNGGLCGSRSGTHMVPNGSYDGDACRYVWTDSKNAGIYGDIPSFLFGPTAPLRALSTSTESDPPTNVPRDSLGSM